MIVFPSRAPFTAPRPGEFVLNRSSEQARGLLLWVTPGLDQGTFRDRSDKGLHPTSITSLGPADIRGTKLQRPAVVFSEAADYVTYPAGVLNGRTEATITCIVRPDDTNTDDCGIFGNRQSATSPTYFQFFFRPSSNQLFLSYMFSTLDAWFTGPALTYGETYFLAARRRTSNVNLFVNGAVVGTDSAAEVQAWSSTEAFAIGNWQTLTAARAMKGTYFDLRIYDRFLSDDEIRRQYDPETRWDLYARRRTFVAVGLVGPFYTQTKFQVFNDDGTGLGPP